MTITWKSSLKYLTEDDFIQQASILLDFIPKYKPKCYIQDTSNAIFPISAKIIEWIKNNITPIMEKFGAKYNAILMSADELTSLTLDNFVDIMNIQTKIKRKLFYSIEQAKKWVLEDD